jgi:hypothetical protein
MQIAPRQLLCVVMAGLLLYARFAGASVDGSPVVNIPPEMVASIAPVRASLKQASRSDRAALADLWLADSNLVALPDSPVASPNQVRSMLSIGGKLFVKGGGKEGPAGLYAEVDKFLLAQIGEDDNPLDATSRAKAVAALAALSAAARG